MEPKGPEGGGGGEMEITEVRVYPVDEEKLKAYVTITFDHCFVVRDLKIIHGTNGLFVAMPALWAYNFLTNRIDVMAIELDNSASRVVNHVVRRALIQQS